MEKPSVAVVGAGPSGLSILKNLREEGFNVKVFEKRSSVGGVWAYSDDPQTTSTLPYTLSNVSKFVNSFSDFPMPDELPSHLTSSQACDYLKSYAHHFDLERDVQLNTSVHRINRNKEDTKWQVHVDCAGRKETIKFDKVVICSGNTDKAIVPSLEGMEKFTGKIVHVQGFKRPSDFKNMSVLVLGIGNSAADTSTQLIGHASKIYLSHRGGALIVPRICLGAPLDFLLTRQREALRNTVDRYFPSLNRWIFHWTIERWWKGVFKLNPSWRFSPAPPLEGHQPVVTDHLVDSLWAGDVVSVHGLSRFIGDNKVELIDGTVLEVDAVVLCTGYDSEFSLISDFSPLEQDTEEKTGKNQNPLPRLYYNLFPPKYSDSLAYLNYCALTGSAMGTIDLCAMAIAQVWKGGFALPSEEEMNAEIDKHHEWVRSLGKYGSVYAGIVRPGPWFAFTNRAAGTGVNENLGYGWEGWKFWMRERELCNLLMRGVMTPFVYKLFDGRRKKWEGAKDAILHSNEHARIYRK